jgi:hypothetical protein
MRLATGWRVGFHTPRDRCDICSLCAGATFEEAARRALTIGAECETRERSMRAILGENAAPRWCQCHDVML